MLAPGGIALGDEVLPLLAGSAHYWRLDPTDWRPALTALRDLGLGIVDTYVPWGEHEVSPGEFDFGEHKPRRDVAKFLGIAHELGLKAIVRPGPHINAELTFFGIPERVIWDHDCQARSPKGKPVVLPVAPLAFPVPSHASELFHTEVAQWFSAVGAELSPLCWPNGPIVMAQVDNESALYFRDGVYDQDYHPDVITQYRHFLQQKYGRVSVLREVYRSPKATFAKIDPPRHFDASAAYATPHLDWAEFQEKMIADALTRMSDELDTAGLTVPISQNFPIVEVATPLDAEAIGRAVDLIGLDYYGPATPRAREEIAHRTTELANRANVLGYPAFGCEIGAGCPPFLPPLSEQENEFTVLSALAYGLRGFNVYMAVERDRWIGAPIDPRGRPRKSSEFWGSLVGALTRVSFHELRRETPVHIVVPRSLRRLERALHAFGPLSASFLRVAGFDSRESAFEDELGPDGPDVARAAEFLDIVERSLERRGVPYTIAGGDLLDESLRTSRWTIVASCGALERRLLERLQNREPEDASVTLGPEEPKWDEAMRALSENDRFTDKEIAWSRAGVPARLGIDTAEIDGAIAAAIDAFDLPTHEAKGSLGITLHRDADGAPRVLFVINATSVDAETSLALDGVREVEDALDLGVLPQKNGCVTVRVPAQSVRMLALTPDP